LLFTAYLRTVACTTAIVTAVLCTRTLPRYALACLNANSRGRASLLQHSHDMRMTPHRLCRGFARATIRARTCAADGNDTYRRGLAAGCYMDSHLAWPHHRASRLRCRLLPLSRFRCRIHWLLLMPLAPVVARTSRIHNCLLLPRAYGSPHWNMPLRSLHNAALRMPPRPSLSKRARSHGTRRRGLPRRVLTFAADNAQRGSGLPAMPRRTLRYVAATCSPHGYACYGCASPSRALIRLSPLPFRPYLAFTCTPLLSSFSAPVLWISRVSGS